MFHAVATLLFAIFAVYYLSFETKKKLLIKKGWGYLLVAILLPLFGSFLSKIVGGTLGNFLLHAVGGGMSATFLFYYLCGLLEYKLNWRVELITLFAFVSCLGVLNELLEYVIELTTPLIMSLDSQDTWRDLVANTSGALVAWTAIKVYLYSFLESK